MKLERKPVARPAGLVIRNRPAILLSLSLAVIAVAILVARSLSWSADNQTRGPSESAPVANDVSVLSLDFDPPLGARVAAGRERALLVVIDNRGTEPQLKLKVDADVIDAASGSCLKTVSEPVNALTPGEVKVLRFERIGQAAGDNVPAAVRLSVTVRTEDGESFTDGTRSLPVSWASVLKVD